MRPRVMVLRTDGTNCDAETLYAFDKAGADSNLVHVNQLRSGEEKLADYQIMVIPGGFSYGDDVHSGKILAVEMTSFLREQLSEFMASKKLILGICNGFQVLVRTGILPRQEIGEIRAALIGNDSGHFECRWVKLRVEKGPCIFTQGLQGRVLDIMVAHAEGKFYTDSAALDTLEREKMVVFRYAGPGGENAASYPDNPNGSLHAIAGICDPSGRVMGLMPHPERFVEMIQHPDWHRGQDREPHGLAIFQNAVRYASSM